jgi:hypothetical protein
VKLSHWLFVIAFVMLVAVGVHQIKQLAVARREAAELRTQLEEKRHAQEIARHTMRLCGGVERRRSLEVRP